MARRSTGQAQVGRGRRCVGSSGSSVSLYYGSRGAVRGCVRWVDVRGLPVNSELVLRRAGAGTEAVGSNRKAQTTDGGQQTNND
jgi:hypothetical protein